MKLWFGVSKFASTSSLVYAVDWENASDLVRTSPETRTALGPVSMSNYTMPCMLNFPTGITRRNICLWLSNGPHDLVCQSRQCYIPAEGCVCVNCVIALPTINHTSCIAGGRLKMSPLT